MTVNGKYGLAYLSLDEIPTDTSAAAASDVLLRWDASAGQWVQVDADDLNALFGVTATAAELNYNDITTLGTGAASKAVVLDASGDYTYPATGTITYPSGATATFASGSTLTLSGTVTRTPASITGTDSITQAEHANRVNIITGTSAATLTLPEATGTGDVYTFIFGQVNTNSTVFVAADTSNTSIGGSLNILDADSNAQTAYFATSGDDTITINGTTTGGLIGDTIVLTDIATDQWAVSGQLVCPAGSNVADMFSSAA